MAKLERDAQEIYWWDIDGLPAGVDGVEVQFDEEGSWHPLTLVDGAWGIMLAGPDFTSVDSTAVQLTETASVRLRVLVDPQKLPRPAGVITIADAADNS
jgi:hypothetical protein